MEWRRRRIPGVRHPDGMAAERNSECETPGWNDGGEGIPSVRHPDGMSYVTHRKGGRPRAREREPRGIFLGRSPQVGESLERETGLVGRMDMEAWVSGFKGYAKK